MKGLQRKTKFRLILGCIVLILLTPIFMYFSHDIEILKTQYPHIQIDDDKEVRFQIKPGKPKTWINLKSISSYGKWAIIFSEDWAFYQHDGVDLEQMKVALAEMLEVNRFRGASTITQQMVKNVYLHQYPTLWRKFHEIILAQKVEVTLSKPRILEIYLNCIEYGPGIYGIKAAAFHFFKKHPSQLTPREGAFLAMLLPSPKVYYVSFKKKKLTDFARSRVKANLMKMRMGKIITPEQYQSALNSRFSWER